MKHRCIAISLVILISILSSCGRNIPLEDLTISLILGIDLDDENNLIFSESSPVFNKDAKSKLETYQIKAKSIRESRKYFDALATGEVTAAKIQVLLIGKRVLEHENWFSILDTVYRNPTFSINTKVIMVDGAVSDVIFFEPKDKPQLPLYLKELIEKNIERTRTVVATLQVLHRQMFDKGITPSISEIKREKDLELVGVSLLDNSGKYIDTLSIQDSSLLLVLKSENRQELTFSFPLSSIDTEEGIFNKNEVSIDVNRVNTRVKTKYDKGRFNFTFQIDMRVDIVERLFSMNRVKEKELEKMIESELKSRFESLIKKIQQNKIDPIGLGLYARAYEYQQYKKVEEHWGEALAKSNIEISLNVDLHSMGATK